MSSIAKRNPFSVPSFSGSGIVTGTISRDCGEAAAGGNAMTRQHTSAAPLSMAPAAKASSLGAFGQHSRRPAAQERRRRGGRRESRKYPLGQTQKKHAA